MLRHRTRVPPVCSRPGAHRQSIPSRLHNRQHRHLRESPPPGKNLLGFFRPSQWPLCLLSVLCVKFLLFAFATQRIDARTMTDTDLAFASIEDVALLYRKRKVSPLEVTKLMLARIDQLNPKVNAYLTVTAELALAQAKKAEAELFAPRGRKGHRDRGPLHGIPISLKDNIYTKGIRTTAGSKILKDFIPKEDAVVVAPLKQAGAVLLGKTNMHEFAYGVTSNNPHYGPVCNPWDPARIPGGSSGGSAAAVSAGLCYGSVGTDTGGSIRIPASLCGITGLKPSWGPISCEGVIPLSPSLDCAGPLARTVGDVAILTGVLYSRVGHEPNLTKLSAPRAGPGKFCLGIPRQLFFDAVSPEVRKAVDAAVRELCLADMTAKHISIPLLDETED